MAGLFDTKTLAPIGQALLTTTGPVTVATTQAIVESLVPGVKSLGEESGSLVEEAAERAVSLTNLTMLAQV